MKKISHHTIKQFLRRPDGEIDLHGLTRLEAIKELENFLRQANNMRWESVKVITGRGLNSPDGKAVLKESVIQWLGENGYKYSIAKGKEGGPGSVIVTID